MQQRKMLENAEKCKRKMICKQRATGRMYITKIIRRKWKGNRKIYETKKMNK